MCKELKLFLFLSIFFVNFIWVSADTQMLSRIGILLEDSERYAVISLDNDQQLLVDGSFVQHYEIANDSKNRLTLTVIYVADKDGYKAKYVLVKKEFQRPAYLNPSTLKSSTG